MKMSMCPLSCLSIELTEFVLSLWNDEFKRSVDRFMKNIRETFLKVCVKNNLNGWLCYDDLEKVHLSIIVCVCVCWVRHHKLICNRSQKESRQNLQNFKLLQKSVWNLNIKTDNHILSSNVHQKKAQLRFFIVVRWASITGWFRL